MEMILRVRRGTTSQWASSTKVLLVGEIGLDTTLNKIKFGNGSSLWTALPFANVTPAELKELTQDNIAEAISNGTHSHITVTYDDVANTFSFATNPEVVISSGLTNTLGDYLTKSEFNALLDQPDGIPTLDINGLIRDEEIPSSIARDSEVTSAINTLNSSVTSTINSTNLELTDSIIYLSADQFSTDAVDIGIYGAYGSVGGTSENHKHTGIFRDATDQKWKFISNGVEPTNNIVDLTNVVYDTIKVGSVEGDLLGNVTGNVTGNLTGNITGNAATVTNGIYTNGSYSDPSWLTITKTKVGLSNVDNTSDLSKPISTATQTALDAKSDNIYTYVTDSSTSRIISSSDKYKMIEFTSALPITVTIPNDATDASFPIGSYVEIRQMGSGQITVSHATPAKLVSADSQYKTRVQYSSVMLEKRASDSWIMTGDTTA